MINILIRSCKVNKNAGLLLLYSDSVLKLQRWNKEHSCWSSGQQWRSYSPSCVCERDVIMAGRAHSTPILLY